MSKANSFADLNGSQLTFDDYTDEPIENSNYAFAGFQLVGHGEQTNEKCGKFLSFYGCIRTDLHNKRTLDGVDYSGKVYVRPYFHSCDKPSCPICYKMGWAVREAGKIEGRLQVASLRFGLVEHIIATFPPKYYHLSYEKLRAKAIEVLKRRGVVGGVLIFHAFRYNTRKFWYWSPHFHCLGFVLGGYGKCRGCPKCVKGCGGFVDRQFRAYEKDGCIVRVLGKRKTVGGTAWYQLHHASAKIGAVRFHVATWFGNCSYRKLKVTVEMRKSVCPICQHDLVRLRYFGGKRFVLDRHSPFYRREFIEDYREGDDGIFLGNDVWIEASVRRFD